ncbi:MAG TPA: PAS domain-containing protein, partial [Vicinamibacterales bacterium]|nr:PAS domain-containing protein [Vicinamibacterales bacterium]
MGRPRILVAGADPGTLDAVARSLGVDYDTEVVRDADAALARARQDAWDLIIADTAVPQVGGLALLRQLRAGEQTRTLPVMLLSASSDDAGGLAVAMAAGAVDYVTAPFSPDALRARVAARLESAQLLREAAAQQVEAAVLRGREQLQLVSDNVPALISYVDTECRYRWCNRAYTEWFAMPVSAVVGRTMREVLGDDAWKTIGPNIETALRGERVEYEAQAKYRVGGTRWIHAVYTPHRDDSGAVIGAIVMVHDITEARRSAEALVDSTSRFDLVRDGAEVGFWFCDLPFDKLIWDNRVKEHFWLPPDAEVTIETFYDRLHPDDRERTRAAIDASIANHTQYDIEYRTLSGSGGEKW